MAQMLSRSQLQGCSAFRASRPRPSVSRAPVAARRVQRSTVQVQAFFNFLAPKPSAGAAVNPKARELAEALLEVVSQTKPGTAVSPVTKAEVEELVSELEPLCMKNPLKSPLLWGTYDVVYCSKPSAVGGPLTKGAGPVLAAGQQARQILEPPGSLVNEVSFKTLGLLPGFSRQYGQIQPLSGDTFLLSIKEGEISTGLGTQSKSFDIERQIKIVYLDEDLRIARFLPSDSADSEQEASGEGPEEDEILFVFQRVVEQEEEEEEEVEEVEEEEEPERPVSPLQNLFGGTRKVESLATQAERRVQEQRTRKGTQPFFIGGRSRDAQEEEEEEEREDPRAARARAQAEKRAAQERAKQEAAQARSAEQARAAKERAAAEREKEAERARAQREKEAEERARAQAEARERAEAEKAARAERAGQIRELLAELSDELKGAQAEAREAQKEAKEVQRDNQSVLRQVAQAEAAIAAAERDVQEVSAALEEAAAVRKGVEQQFKAAQQAVREAEAAYKQKVGARR